MAEGNQARINQGKEVAMSIKKRFLKTRPVCKVTFRLPKETAQGAETVHLVGEFNNWETTTPMRKLKNGDFDVTLDLETGRAYQFRYLVNRATWENDQQADGYAPSAYPGTENSVIEAIP
jgi:1,4-alpha-glucan branching enzyme